MDFHTLVDPASGGLAPGPARPGALSVGVAVDAAVQAHRHHRRCGFQLPARDFDAAGASVEGTVGRKGVIPTRVALRGGAFLLRLRERL